MKEGLLIGGGIVVAGVFVGYVAYKIAKKSPKLLATVRKKTSDVGKRTSGMIADAKQGFSEGFAGTYYGSQKKAPVTA